MRDRPEKAIVGSGTALLRRFLPRPRTSRAVRRRYLNWAYSHRRSSRAKLFDAFYRENRWGDPDTPSGPGSNIEQTKAVREELPTLWEELGIRRLADVPCGDLFWMSAIVERLDYYFGGDIVPELLELARERAPEHCEFRVFDLLTDDFPAVDAILTRDVLPALSNRDVETVLQNVARSSARYFISTTFCEAPSQDITTGGWRPLNLCAPPFSLPTPLRLIDERCTVPGFAGKSLGVWGIAALHGRET